MKTGEMPIIVLGAGSWGTALALLLARNRRVVRLWCRNADRARIIDRNRVNARYLPHHPFPENLQVTSDLQQCLSGVQDVLIAVPSFAFAEMLERIKPFATPKLRIAWATKGVTACGKLLNHVVEEKFGQKIPQAILSGPSLALEVADGLPTAVSLASNDKTFAQDLLSYFHQACFRIYLNNDIVGLEVCGAVKNVLAIATGISDGLVLGANARAALITRGLAEMSRLVLALGGQSETVIGLAGLGDLVLTCTDDKSRNRRFGLLLGTGIDQESAKSQIGQVIEGLHNVEQVFQLAKKYHIEMPITHQVFRIIYDGLDPQHAVDELLNRSLKNE